MWQHLLLATANCMACHRLGLGRLRLPLVCRLATLKGIHTRHNHRVVVYYPLHRGYNNLTRS